MKIDTLRQPGAFLAMSRKEPEKFQKPNEFTLKNETRVRIIAPGVIVFEPALPGNKDIVLSCGIHGNETAPIEICDELVSDLLAEKKQAAHRVLFIFGNLPAMDIAERFVEENMNRLFCGAHSKPEPADNPERIRARLLEESVRAFYNTRVPNPAASEKSSEVTRLHYDLHTAIRASKNEKFAVYPFLHGKPHNIEQLQFLLSCGVSTILLSESPTTTFSYFSSVNFDAHAFTVELGKVRPFGENDMTKFAAAKASLERLITGQPLELKPFNADDFHIYRVNQVINKQQRDFRLNFGDDTPNFTDFSKGTLLAEESGQAWRCEYDGEAIVFPNANVAIGQRALLTVVPTSIES